MYLCYHHNDMDGKAAGNEVYKYLVSNGITPIPSMFIMRGYDEPFSEDDYGNKVVFIVDLSFTTTSIQKLFAICEGASKVIWIDHHESSCDCIKNDDILSKLKSYDNLKFFVNKNACGALLSELYFHGAFGDEYSAEECLDFNIRWKNKKSEIKVIVDRPDGSGIVYESSYFMKLVDLWDRWDYEDFKDPVLFNFGCGLHNTSLFAYASKDATEKTYNKFWKFYTIGRYTREVVDEGVIAKKYFDSSSIKKIRASSYECNVLGHKALVLNSDGNSMVFGNKIDKYDLVILWTYNGKLGKYQYSFYSSDTSSVNCEKVARHFDSNGGGHIHAAGCSSDKLLFVKE